MNSAFSSKTAPRKVSVFVDEELTCPICDSYDVAEERLKFECHTCGTSWKVNNLDR